MSTVDRARPADKRIAVFAGSFDPFTHGHREVVENALRVFDELIVAIGEASGKQPTFTVDERIAMIREVVGSNPRVKIASFNGLVVQYAKANGAIALVRGLRTEADFSYEMPMAMTNKSLESSVLTVFFPTSSQFAYVSSSLVREVASHGGDVSAFVPPSVHQRVVARFAKREK